MAPLDPSHMPLAFLTNLVGGMDGLVVLIVGLLFFGRRLPEVGKNLGRTIVEFKKGLSGGYSEDGKDKSTEEPPEAPEEPRRLSSGSRVSVNQNLDDPQQRPRPVVRSTKRLPESEEV